MGDVQRRGDRQGTAQHGQAEENTSGRRAGLQLGVCWEQRHSPQSPSAAPHQPGTMMGGASVKDRTQEFAAIVARLQQQQQGLPSSSAGARGGLGSDHPIAPIAALHCSWRPRPAHPPPPPARLQVPSPPPSPTPPPRAPAPRARSRNSRGAPARLAWASTAPPRSCSAWRSWRAAPPCLTTQPKTLTSCPPWSSRTSRWVLCRWRVWAKAGAELERAGLPGTVGQPPAKTAWNLAVPSALCPPPPPPHPPHPPAHPPPTLCRP